MTPIQLAWAVIHCSGSSWAAEALKEELGPRAEEILSRCDRDGARLNQLRHLLWEAMGEYGPLGDEKHWSQRALPILRPDLFEEKP